MKPLNLSRIQRMVLIEMLDDHYPELGGARFVTQSGRYNDIPSLSIFIEFGDPDSIFMHWYEVCIRYLAPKIGIGALYTPVATGVENSLHIVDQIYNLVQKRREESKLKQGTETSILPTSE